MPAPKGNKYALGNKNGHPKYWTRERVMREAEALLEWMETTDKYFLKSFCFERGILPKHMTEWADEYQEFKEVYDIAKNWQEGKMTENAINGKAKEGFTKFMLLNNCGQNGYHEKPTVIYTNIAPTEDAALIKQAQSGPSDLRKDS